MALAARNAASKARKRIRKRAPTGPDPKLTKREEAVVLQPEDVARSLGVQDEDRAEVAKETRDLRGRVKVVKEDPIQTLVEGDDPNLFGVPFIWIQLAHVLVAFTAVLFSLGGGSDDSVWTQPPVVTNALRLALIFITFFNLGLAVFTFWEEDSLGESKRINAVGWGLKTALFGGVATWQRNWRNRPAVTTKRVVKDKNKPKAAPMAR